jgi:hypothetical protein
MRSIKILSAKEIHPYLSDMWAVYSQYYNDPEVLFKQRLFQIDRQALFFSGKTLVGFTGVVVDRDLKMNGDSYTLIGLEQTVIDVKYRHQGFIQRTCTRLFLQEKWHNPQDKVFLWSANASYLPYLIFTQYLKVAYPAHFCPLTEEAKGIMSFLGEKHLDTYPFKYYPNTPYSVFQIENGISDENIKITEHGLKNLNIFYYNQLLQDGQRYLQNPLHQLLLITIAPANWTNLLFWIKRFSLKKINSVKKSFIIY